MRLKITISGVPGSGKSTVSRELAKRLKLKLYSVGDFSRKLAMKKKLSMSEFGALAEKDPAIDKELDSMTKKLAKKDNFVIVGRTAYYFLPKSFKIFLSVDLKVAAKRIFQDMRPSVKENSSLANTLKGIKERIKNEKKRYKQYYNTDPYELNNYDLVIDTTHMPAVKVADAIIAFVKCGC